MKNLLLITITLLVLVLSGCKKDEQNYNFRPRQNDTYISDDGNILIEYKTDKDGALQRVFIDRLLTIDQMITNNPYIDYNVTVDGFDGAIFTAAPAACLLPSDVQVPLNIEVGSVRYKFKTTECIYKEVGRDNEFKTTSFAKEYEVNDTIQEPLDSKVHIVVYIEGSTNLFTEVFELHHTLRSLGVYAIELSVDNGLPLSNAISFTKDMKIYEQMLLQKQDNELAVNEIYGYSSDINILNIDDFDSITSIIENFTDIYENEYNAMLELQLEIGIKPVKETVEESETSDDETTNWKWKNEY